MRLITWRTLPISVVLGDHRKTKIRLYIFLRRVMLVLYRVKITAQDKRLNILKNSTLHLLPGTLELVHTRVANDISSLHECDVYRVKTRLEVMYI